MASRAPSRGRQVNAFQLLALLLAFVLVATVGGVVAAGLVVPLAAGASTATSSAVKIFDELPADLKPGPLSEQSRVYASDGKTLLARFYVENRIVVPLSEVSQPMRDAVIATEDKRFWDHGGVDIEGISRAAVKNLTSDSQEGASTLTQQYVKNVLIEKAVREGDTLGVMEAKEGTLDRKAREAKLAVSLEKEMSKEDILQGYLNIAQFGTKVYGVETAARHYFGKSAKDLTVIEAATIAGVTKGPSLYDPIANPEKAQERRNVVLSQMYQQKFIDKAEYDQFRAIPIADTLHVQPIDIGCQSAAGAAFFCDYVTKVITSDEIFGKTKDDREGLLYRGGLDIYTTLDVRKQRAAEAAAVDAVPPSDPSGLETALVSVEPGTGKIVAMAQNRPYDATESPAPGSTAINYSTDQAHGGSRGFSPGSTFKAFVLAEWLKEGNSLYQTVNSDRRTWDTSRSFHSSCGGGFSGTWSPRNSDGQGHGNISVLTATYNSVNTAYASMESRLDLCGVGKTAWDVGFRPSMTGVTEMKIVPSMVLGVQETSPLAQTNAYATFASGGIYCNPIAITKVIGADGQELPVPSADCRRVLDENIANTINYALTKVMTQGSGRTARPADGRPAAGKTGTAQSSRHTWFMGYTPSLATGVWVGNAETDEDHLFVKVKGRTYSPLFGSSVAAPEWKAYMDVALTDVPVTNFGTPDWGRVNAPKPVAPAKPRTEKNNASDDKPDSATTGGGDRAERGGARQEEKQDGGENGADD